MLGTDEHLYIIDGELVSNVDEEDVSHVEGQDVKKWTSGALAASDETSSSGASVALDEALMVCVERSK